MLKSDPAFTIIARTEPFSELTPPHMQSLASLCRMRRYAKGETIFHMGEAGDALYGIKTGRVRTTIISPEGKEMTLNLFGPLSTFGVVGFLDGGPRMATAVSLEPSEIFRLPRGEFLAFIRTHPEVAVHVIGYLCGKLRSIKERVGETALLPLAASSPIACLHSPRSSATASPPRRSNWRASSAPAAKVSIGNCRTGSARRSCRFTAAASSFSTMPASNRKRLRWAPDHGIRQMNSSNFPLGPRGKRSRNWPMVILKG